MNPITESILQGTHDDQSVYYGITLMKSRDVNPVAESTNSDSTGVIPYSDFRNITRILAPKWYKEYYLKHGDAHAALCGNTGPGEILKYSANLLALELMGNQSKCSEHSIVTGKHITDK